MPVATHIVRNAAFALVAVVAAIVAAGLLEDGALAVIVGLLALGVIAVFIPLAVIHYDEHPDRLVRRGPGNRV